MYKEKNYATDLKNIEVKHLASVFIKLKPIKKIFITSLKNRIFELKQTYVLILVFQRPFQKHPLLQKCG